MDTKNSAILPSVWWYILLPARWSLHSEEEDRFIAIGPVREGVVLIVWTEQDENTTRIISARWATKRGRDRYRSFMEQQE